MNHFALGSPMHADKTNAQNRKLVNATLNLTYPFAHLLLLARLLHIFWNMQLSLHINAKICDDDCYDAAQDPSM